MSRDAASGHLLWSLRGHGRDVRCLRQKTAAGFELRVLWGDELFLTETFHDQERLERRADEFKATLLGRGWSQALPPAEAVVSAPAIPRAPEQQTVPPVPSAGVADGAVARPAGERLTVLIVDDEASIRTFLRRYLQEAGYAVTEAGDVDTALNALDATPVDAVVLDVRLPDPMGWGRTGLEVLAFIRLHASFARLPVLILTGHPPDMDEQELIQRHGAHLFMKPDGYRKLLQRLDELAGGTLIRH